MSNDQAQALKNARREDATIDALAGLLDRVKAPTGLTISGTSEALTKLGVRPSRRLASLVAHTRLVRAADTEEAAAQ